CCGSQATIKTFRCPSAFSPESYVTASVFINYGTAGVDYPMGIGGATPPFGHVFSSAPGRLVVGRSNYTGMAGYYAKSQYPQYEGIMTWNSKNTIQGISDGSSNTVMFCETAGGNIPWGGSGGIPNGVSAFGWVGGFNYGGSGPPIQYDTNNGSMYAYFNSRHTGIVNACFGDGSVRSISTTIDFATWVYITGMSDGVSVNF